MVLVLAFISLLSALLIAFFSSTSNSRREAAQFEAGVSVAQLAETAQNVVMGQIADGTKTREIEGYKETPITAGEARYTYASQPGLIRTYDNGGNAKRVFKLYSSGQMNIELAKGTDWIVKDKLTEEVPANWVQMPAGYTDLNEPVLVPDPQGLVVPPNTTQRFTANYPIIDPSALSPTGNTTPGSPSQDGVDGFDLLNVPGYGGPVNSGRPLVTATYNPLNIPANGKTGNPAPMPVQWLYVLQNGTITSPATIDGMTCSWKNLKDGSANKPSKTNPIVGRIAFWTDDDTCKLNPNVNSEGTAWDVPLRGSDGSAPYGERSLRDNQPILGEYQRYPGHPAMTSLSPVFGFLPQYRIPSSDTAQDYNILSLKYYAMVPRVAVGGSMGGMASTASSSGVTKIVQDMDRLYASPEEVVFNPFPRTSGRDGFLNRGALEKVKFFLTTSARSPETTLFGTPRVGLWSIQREDDPNNGAIGSPKRARSATDELIAFCNTLGKAKDGHVNRYYFERNSIYLRDPVNNRIAHPTVPCGQLPPTYVMPSSQSTTADWNLTTKDGRKRNQDLYKYLKRMATTPVPGFGGVLGGQATALYPKAADLGAGQVPPTPSAIDQILTEMLDMTRLTNCYSLQTDNGQKRFEFAPARQMPDAVSGETQIVPVVPDVNTINADGYFTKGFGRFSTVTEAMFIFYRSVPTPAGPGGNPAAHDNMRIVLALEPYTPNAGSWSWSPLTRYVVKGLNTMKISVPGQAGKLGPLFPAEATNFVTSRCGYASGGAHTTAHTGTFANFRRWMGSARDTTKTIPTNVEVQNEIGGVKLNEENYYPFVSLEVPLDASTAGKTFTMDPFSIVIEIHTGYADHTGPDTLVQTINMDIPGCTLNFPTASSTPDFYQRMSPEPGNNGSFNPVLAGDIVRSVEVNPTGPTKGDLRMVASAKVVPSTYYGPAPNYTTTSTLQTHSFRNGDGGAITGGSATSTLVAGLASDNFIAARGMAGAMMNGGQLGDWDTGYYGFLDGAYINKPDDHYGIVGNDTYDALTTTPNRQVSSAVMFGSLPVGEPWRTLCFTAEPAAGSSHPNFTKSWTANSTPRARDHLFLDFFTMPVVEPFAISEPMSSMGKVNLNYQIAPFSYITRSTALQGVLKTTRMFAASAHGNGTHLQIDPVETLKEFQQRFDDKNKGMFRSASEICDMHLVPKGTTLANIKNWWASFKATGDNGRETPYGQIYARTTARSNTFTVHMRVQTLRKRPVADGSDDWENWREGIDSVTGEYRGSTTIERYVDVGSGTFPDFATDTTALLDKYYKFRVVQSKRFNP